MNGLCGAQVRGWAHVGGRTCGLPAGHAGHHSGNVFGCDGCHAIRRGEPTATWDPEGDRGGPLAFCFLCTRDDPEGPAMSTGSYTARQGVFMGKAPCTCGAAYRLHLDGRCPTAYRPGSLEEAQRELAQAEASGDQQRVFVARGDLQRLQGRSR